MQSAIASIPVRLGDRSYEIHITADAIRGLGKALQDKLEVSRVIIVTTPTVERLHGQRLRAGLANAHLDYTVLMAPDGEAAKTLQAAVDLWTSLAVLEVDQTVPLVAFGGGALGDLTGFIAGTYLRGVPLIQVPTTLLAQVDSSVGGKAGVNFLSSKNMLGMYVQPRMVVIDPLLLATLPPGVFRAGIAEVIKDGAVADFELCGWLEQNASAVCEQHIPALETMIRRAVAIKAEAVSADEYDAARRKLLNFGHTIGHALEVLSEFTLSHGEAVAIGMVGASRISTLTGHASADAERAIRALNRLYGLPTQLPTIWWHNEQATIAALQRDKKRRAEGIDFVVLESLGRAGLCRMQASVALDYTRTLRE